MVGRRRWLVAAASALTLGALSLGCNDKKDGHGGDIKPEDNGKLAPAGITEWRVGAYLSLSGEDAAFGTDTKEGIELAMDEVNKAGGVKGKPVKVLYEDDKSKPDEA